MATELFISLLGSFKATLNNEPLTQFRTKSVQALLIYLVCEAERPHQREQLMALLWPRMPLKSAQANMRQTLYRLRKLIPEVKGRNEDAVPFLLTNHQTVQINPDADYFVDVESFSTAIESDPNQAIELYRGDFLADFYLPDSETFEEWAASRREAYRRQVLGAMEEVTAVSIQNAKYDQAIHLAQRQLAIDNLRESSHRQLMEVLARNGRRREALSHYETLRQLLQDELALQPEAETETLIADIRAGKFPQAAPTTVPSLHLLDEQKPKHNLPRQLTSFIGREKEIAAVSKLLVEHPLVTLTGSGGVGKTRLSIQTVSTLNEEYPNGVWLVELAPITDPEFVPRAICGVLGINLPGNATPLTVLTEYLYAKKLLLVLDNCEHLIHTCARICDSLLHACSSLHILASSREALGIDGENSYHVPSLSLPDPKGGVAAIEETESVKLFIDRAKALLPTFALNETNASAVAQICNRLDGIPLAIELAASRVKLLKVEQIASRLDDVFRLLTGGSRTALPRQQTLRAMIDWSYNLLSEPEKILFRRLAVFAGGWTMEAAEEICSIEGVDQYDILDLMARLVDKSLVVVTRQGTESRYRRLETIRQYARERLAESGEGESLRNRHMAYFCKLVERIEPGLRGPNQVSLMDGLEIELDNLRAALEWALDHDVSAGLQLAYKLHWLWHVRSYWSEGADWLEKFLHAESESLGSETRTETQIFHRAKALGVLIDKSFNLGDLQSVKACVEEGLALCEKLEGAIGIPPLASFIAVQAIIALLSGDVRQAKILAENSLALSQQSGNKFDVAEVEANVLIDLAARSGDWEAARLVNESNLATRRELGDKEGIAFGLYRGGILAVSQGDNELAHQLFESAVEASREAASDFLLGLSLGNLGAVYLLKGDMNQAHVYILQLARLAQEKWNPTHKATSICLLALYGFERKQFRKFLQLYGFLQGENPIIVYFYQFKFLETVLQKNMAIARAEIGEGIFKQAEAEGKAMTLDQALDYALEEFNV